MIRRQHAQGFDFIKLYSFLSRGEFHEAMTTAKQLGMYTAGHIPFSVGLHGILIEGMDEIAHIEELDFEFIEFDRNAHLSEEEWFAYIVKEAVIQYGLHQGFDSGKLRRKIEAVIPTVVERLRVANVPVCTTMVVGDTIVQKLSHSTSFLARSENTYLPPSYFDIFRKGEERHQKQFKGNENLAIFKSEIEKTLLTELHRGGITLLLSTDAGTGSDGIVPGSSIHHELQIMVENGFTPFEAISTGTVNAASVIKKITGQGNFGTIEIGNRADLILMEENPLDDVAHLKRLLGVMIMGRWYPKEMLEKMISF
jgi:imidazolonepropionase-like amidohydrolase